MDALKVQIWQQHVRSQMWHMRSQIKGQTPDQVENQVRNVIWPIHDSIWDQVKDQAQNDVLISYLDNGS